MDTIDRELQVLRDRMRLVAERYRVTTVLGALVDYCDAKADQAAAFSNCSIR